MPEKFFADLHIHSRFSIATSKDLAPESLACWARMKGLRVLGTGDFTHPGWLNELQEKLEPAEEGLYRLKREFRTDLDIAPVPGADADTRFLLSAEISTIYKAGGRVRKVHHVILAPDFSAVSAIQKRLQAIGANITSDGRPILGLDSRDLLEIVLNACDRIFFIPAHIWTPWFSVLGAKSGFDTIEACYRDLSNHIHAVETGLSSDPAMNRLCSSMDRYTLVSNSDAHSCDKLAREANILDTELSYRAITTAIAAGVDAGFLGTLEFFPQEGKYHFDGHRRCGICWHPSDTEKHGGRCPKCGKPITVGVMHRVRELADRTEAPSAPRSRFHSLIPLKEVLSEILAAGPQSKRVNQAYRSLLRRLGPELDILLNVPCVDLERCGGELLAEAIRRMRAGRVHIREGYDGEYGLIRVFREDELRSNSKSLFRDPEPKESTPVPETPTQEFFIRKIRQGTKDTPALLPNIGQRLAVDHFTGPALVLAGPGTGKTRILTERIHHLVIDRGVPAERILAVTFTNQAAREMEGRLVRLLNAGNSNRRPTTVTFHALGVRILKDFVDKTNRSFPFVILDEWEKQRILIDEIGCPNARIDALSRDITRMKLDPASKPASNHGDLVAIFNAYEARLAAHNAFDLDDLIVEPIRLLGDFPDAQKEDRYAFRFVLVDEYQDVNASQYRLLQQLARPPAANLMVIGDPNQSIYAFRGGGIGLIDRLTEDYPDARVYRLKQSYRCSNRILGAAAGVIKSSAAPPVSLSGLEEGLKVHIVETGSERSEAEYVARAVERMMGGLRFFSLDSRIADGHESDAAVFSDVAVLCRTHAQMGAIAEAFDHHAVPYQQVGDIPFFKQEPARTVITVLKWLTRPDQSFYRTLAASCLGSDVLDEIQAGFEAGGGWPETLKVIASHAAMKKPYPPPLLERLNSLAEAYRHDLAGFLCLAALGTAADARDPRLETVSLMTLHAAKGLEFPCVFIVGCEQGLLPLGPPVHASGDVDQDEERRLLYVGMTRAKRFLFLTHAKRRRLFGQTHHLPRSPFLDGIEEQLVEYTGGGEKSRPRREKKEIQKKLFEDLT